MTYRIKNWERFQHYKNKQRGAILPWLKLYRNLLDDVEWHKLSGDASKMLVMLWLIASDEDGQLPCLEKLAFRLRKTEKYTSDLLSTLSHWLYQYDSNMLATGQQEGSQEKEKEKEKEKDIYVEPSKDDGPTAEDLISLWNKEAHPNLPRVQILTETRKRHIQARLAAHPVKDFWSEVISKVNLSPLLRGENGSWKATFDWIMNPSNLVKIVEGNYDTNKRR